MLLAFKSIPNPMMHAFFAAALVTASMNIDATAQGLDSEGAIDTIVDSEVKTEEQNAAEQSESVIAAIERSLDSAQVVRRSFNVDSVDIVFLSEEGGGDNGIAAKREEFADQIVELQQSVEASAIFYHAINSKQILVRDVVAIEFSDDNRDARIFVAGAAPAGAEEDATD